MNKETHLYTYPSKFSKNKRKVLIYYPNSYYVGMSNLGFHTIYHLVKSIEYVYVERGFYPDIYSYETKTHLKEFDLIIFSVSFELDFLNIIDVLLKSNIEILANKRKKPIIAGGGIAVTLNPFILEDVFNFQLIGEGEELILEVIENLNFEKDITLIKGVYVKDMNRITRRIYNKDYIAHSVILTDNTEFSNSMLIEIARGCPFGCKFCAVSYNYRPFRIRDKDKIFEIIDYFDNSFKKVGLISSNVCSHPDFLDICEFILSKNKSFSITSLRLDTLNDEIIKILKKGKNTTFTVAIETGSERLRKIINKRLTDEQIFKAIELFIKNRVYNLKFYFMIGLPNENFEDIEQIVNIIMKIKKMYLSRSKELKYLGKFTISINPFIPKRNTPYFKFEIEKLDELQNKIDYLKKELKKISNVKLIIENIYSAYIQYFLSKRDSKFLKFIIEKVKYRISDKKFIDKVLKM